MTLGEFLNILRDVKVERTRDAIIITVPLSGEVVASDALLDVEEMIKEFRDDYRD